MNLFIHQSGLASAKHFPSEFAGPGKDAWYGSRQGDRGGRSDDHPSRVKPDRLSAADRVIA